MNIEENGVVRSMTEDELNIATEKEVIPLDPITEIQLALAELYEMRVGDSNNG